MAFQSLGPNQPSVEISVDFANDPTSSTRTWVDITTYVRQFTITRGRKDALSRPEVGTLSLTLQNDSGRFDPTNTAGAYSPNVLPMRRVRVLAQWNSVTYNLFHGHIEDWPLSFPNDGKNALVGVRAVDALAVLNLFDLAGKSYAAQVADVRGSAVLVDCGFGTAEMNLRTGQSTMVASGTISSQTAQSMILDVSASENGLWFVNAGGTWVFQDRHFRQTQKSATSGTVGTQGGQIGYRDIRTTYGAQDLANIIKVTASGGTTETTTDASSTATYYQRTITWPVSGTYLVSSQAEALAAAQYIKAIYSTPALRIPEVVAVPAGATANWPTVLAAELSDRLTIRHVRPDGGTITGDKHLEGIGHAASFERDWAVTLSLSDADAQAFWILGDANLSLLGDTTILGY